MSPTPPDERPLDPPHAAEGPVVVVVVSLDDEQRDDTTRAGDASGRRDRTPDGQIRRLREHFPRSTRWSVVGVIPPHPATTTGATGFAAPVLSADEADARARADERAGAEMTAAAAVELGDPMIDQVLLPADRLHDLPELLRRCDADVVATPASSSGSWFWSFLTRDPEDTILDEAPCPVLVIPHDGNPDTAGDVEDCVEPAIPGGAESTRPTAQRVLVAVDDSELDDLVVSHVVRLFGDEHLVVGHVESSAAMVRAAPLATGIGPATGGLAFAEAARRLDQEADAAESVAERAIADAGLDDAIADGERGPVVTGILTLAAEHDVDLIALGTRDRSWFSRLLRPSVSAAVTDRADRPVLVVRADLAPGADMHGSRPDG